ncbi:MAG: trypsin-like serine peptidase [Nitrososphaeraceae archaeon]
MPRLSNMLKDIKRNDLNKLSKNELLEIRKEVLKEFKTNSHQNKKLQLEKFQNPRSEDLVKILRDVEEVIYGVDDRKESYEVTDPKIKANINSTVCLIRKSDLIDNGNGTSTIKTRKFGTSRNLCNEEKFYDQPIAPFCSGFLVANDMITTAAHCVDNSQDLEGIRFIFGYKMKNPNEAHTIIDNSEIYEGQSIVKRVLDGNGSDWAIIKLKNSVSGDHKPVVLQKQGKIADNESVYVIGHPVGLPMKFADGANVKINDSKSFFVCNLDTYGGNSGSPVFNSLTHEVEGILVRGETDFIMQNGCYKSKVCPQNPVDPNPDNPANVCRGEDCTRTSEFLDYV